MTNNEKEEMALLLIYMDWQLQRMDRVLMGEKFKRNGIGTILREG